MNPEEQALIDAAIDWYEGAQDLERSKERGTLRQACAAYLSSRRRWRVDGNKAHWRILGADYEISIVNAKVSSSDCHLLAKQIADVLNIHRVTP